ncbi:MAG: hypothetical protein IH840_00355 [Candidatus Heimdallarchaeota archaeon]|nr:hypothetical protein [Candidatus Heimdallarchaeota archaeon]
MYLTDGSDSDHFLDEEIPHLHSESSEYYFTISGNDEVKVLDQTYTIPDSSFLRVPTNTCHERVSISNHFIGFVIRYPLDD